MHLRLLYSLFIVLLLFPPAQAQSWKAYPYQPAGGVLTFPDDEGWHPGEMIEWWYTTAQLTGETTGKKYTVMLTYFAFDTLGFDGFRILNIADETAGTFYTQTLPCLYTTLAEDHLEIRAFALGSGLEEWTTQRDAGNRLLPFQYHLRSGASGNSIDLTYDAVKPPLLVGGKGYLPQGASSYTYYYSQTGIEASGTLTLGGQTESVSGTAWIDRQYGTTNPLASAEPWEWFSLQLSNGMDINLWNLFTPDNRIPDTITFRFLTAYIDETTSATTGDLTLERLGFVRQANSSRVYARQWRLRAAQPAIDLVITLNQTDHEVILPFRFIEGSTSIQGTINGQVVTGRGFAELLHQYEDPELTFTVPQGTAPWAPTTPLAWQLLNPDDGRPIYYDVAVGTEENGIFRRIADRLIDTEFLIDPTPLSVDSMYYFRVTGYSIDRTLIDSVQTGRAYAIGATGVVPLPPALRAIRIFPNPFSDQLFIDLPKDWPGGNVEMRLSTRGGQLLFTRLFSTPAERLSFPLGALPAGVYVLELRTAQGRGSWRVVRGQTP